MICVPCKRRDHAACPEAARQVRMRSWGLRIVTDQLHLVTGQVCDCAHEPGTALRFDRKPDPRRGA